MSQTPPNVKVYDRPERKGPVPVWIIVAVVVVLLIIGFVLYKAFYHAAPNAPATVAPGMITVQTAFWQEKPNR